MLIGSLVVPWVVLRIGQVRAFIICVLMGAVAILSLPSLIEPWSWVLLRGTIGLSLAGLYAIAESWFNGKSDNAHRGSALGIYSVVQYLGWSSGNQVFRLADPGGLILFLVAADDRRLRDHPASHGAERAAATAQAARLALRLAVRDVARRLRGGFADRRVQRSVLVAVANLRRRHRLAARRRSAR